jgi:hypothetical protein
MRPRFVWRVAKNRTKKHPDLAKVPVPDPGPFDRECVRHYQAPVGTSSLMSLSTLCRIS